MLLCSFSLCGQRSERQEPKGILSAEDRNRNYEEIMLYLIVHILYYQRTKV